MMTVQVSNARWMTFTALALVVFAILALRAYWIACDEQREVVIRCYHSTIVMVGPFQSVYAAVLMAMVPAIFLSFAVSDTHLSLKRLWICLSVGFFFGTILIASYLGKEYAGASCWAYVEEIERLPSGEPLTEGMDPTDVELAELDRELAWMRSLRPRIRLGLAELPERHEVSWFMLFLPIILTSAFVIFGARRQAVRDAARLAAGGEE